MVLGSKLIQGGTRRDVTKTMRVQAVCNYLLMTGILFPASRLMILVSSPTPDKQGMTTSVNTRSKKLLGSSSISQACIPLAAEVTAEEKDIPLGKKSKAVKPGEEHAEHRCSNNFMSAHAKAQASFYACQLCHEQLSVNITFHVELVHSGSMDVDGSKKAQRHAFVPRGTSTYVSI